MSIFAACKFILSQLSQVETSRLWWY